MKFIVFFILMFNLNLWANVPIIDQENVKSDFLESSDSEFYKLAVKNDSIAGSISYIKYVIFNYGSVDQSIHFFNANLAKYDRHAKYVKTLNSEFKNLSYREIDRIGLDQSEEKLVYGNVFDIESTYGHFSPAFQIVTSDNLLAENIIKMRDLLKQKIRLYRFVRTLDYYPSNDQLAAVEVMEGSLALSGIKIYRGTEVRSNLEVYNYSWNIGNIVKIKLDSDRYIPEDVLATLNTNSILLLDKLPREFPPVAGIICAEPAQEHSHVNLLTKMYKIPFFYQKDVFANESINRLASNGEKVFLKTTVEKFSLTAISEKMYKRLHKLRHKSKKVITLPLNKVEQELVNIIDVLDKKKSTIGAKADNLALLQRIPQTKDAIFKDAFVIPVGTFHQLTLKSMIGNISLRDFIENRVRGLEKADPVEVNRVLEESKENNFISVREAILNMEVPKELLIEIKKNLDKRFSDYCSVRFRSSSNVEDLSYFNGAGLYDSKKIKNINFNDETCIKDTSRSKKGYRIKEIEKDLKKVWASLYNTRAYLARREFNINESSAGMAVLVHPSFRNELANGVAVTKNSWLFDWQINSNAFKGGELEVTEGVSGEYPEQSIIRKDYEGKIVFSIKRHSSQFDGRFFEVMGKEYYSELFEKIKAVYEMWNKDVENKQELDVEWKLFEENGNTRIILKQVRPVPSQELEFGLTESYFIGEDKKMVFYPAPFETYNALGLLVSPEKITINLEAIILSENIHEILADEDSSSDSVRIKMEYRDGRVINFTKKDVAISFEKGGERSTGHILFKFPNSQSFIQELYIGTHFNNGYVDVYSLDPLSFNIKIPKLVELNDEFLSYKNKKLSETIPRGSGSEDETILASFKGANGEKLSFKGFTRVAGTDKTMELLMDSVLFKNIFSFEHDFNLLGNKKSLVYAPAHHNFLYEYGIDLFFMPESHREQAIKETGGRYLVMQVGDFEVKKAKLYVMSEDYQIVSVKEFDILP